MGVKRLLLDSPGVGRIAERMLADYDAHRPNEIFAERGSDWLTLDDAYAVQQRVAELRTARGERCLGYKVGCISFPIQQQLMLREPVRGYLWQTEVLDSGSRLFFDSRRTDRSCRFVNLAIEGEIALRLGRDISAEALHEGGISDCVQTWFPVIELHNAIFRGAAPSSQELVAGNAMHAGFVAERSPQILPLAALSQAEIRIEFDGEAVETRSLAELPSGPLGSLSWLAHFLTSSNKTLEAGDVVLTGSPGRLIRISGSCHILVCCEGRQVELFVDGDAIGQHHRTQGGV